jgi:hypothetical protein
VGVVDAMYVTDMSDVNNKHQQLSTNTSINSWPEQHT